MLIRSQGSILAEAQEYPRFVCEMSNAMPVEIISLGKGLGMVLIFSSLRVCCELNPYRDAVRKDST